MKRGFTLIELLGVIIILSLLVTISGVAVTKMVKKSKTDLTDTQKVLIKQAAMLWSEDNYSEVIDATGSCVTKNLDDLSAYINNPSELHVSNISVRICADLTGEAINFNYTLVEGE